MPSHQEFFSALMTAMKQKDAPDLNDIIKKWAAIPDPNIDFEDAVTDLRSALFVDESERCNPIEAHPEVVSC
jgi:hypothetical protein